jgi:hypothetical protein
MEFGLPFMNLNLADCRIIKLILSLIKENTFEELVQLVVFVITTVRLKNFLMIFSLYRSTTTNYSTNIETAVALELNSVHFKRHLCQ